MPWWGEGRPPEQLWPGVSVVFSAIWSRVRGRWESPDGRYYFDARAAELRGGHDGFTRAQDALVYPMGRQYGREENTQ